MIEALVTYDHMCLYYSNVYEKINKNKINLSGHSHKGLIGMIKIKLLN